MNRQQHNERWIKEIMKYIDDDNPDNIVKLCLSYTLQSLRHNPKEVFERFKWEYGYYYPNDCNTVKKALEMEKDYFLNCSDWSKDYSPEASNRRIENRIKDLKREKYDR